MKEYNYYQSQLDNVLKNDYPNDMQIKIAGVESETNWLMLNDESIEHIRKFLDKVETIISKLN